MTRHNPKLRGGGGLGKASYIGGATPRSSWLHITNSAAAHRSINATASTGHQRVSSPPVLIILRTVAVFSKFRDSKITVGVFASYLCAEGWLDTSHLRGGAGPGRASCIGGATFSHRQNSSTPLMSMQFGRVGD
ncbi:hypothetical protein PUN28_015418 [Cardiocondyla obscurior]|uniref:Uncharacterized protein n=1 Tax=Cardiocondyla obscurior TaxID=286306 RepID=A0AAW2EWU0_9HYME